MILCLLLLLRSTTLLPLSFLEERLGCEEAAILKELAMSTLTYLADKPYYSSLTKRYYATFDEAFLDSVRESGGLCNFNLYLVHPNGESEFVY